MKNILFIHPEGNINNNLSLFAIIELLCDNDYHVDILAKRNNAINQDSYFDNLQIIFYEKENDLNIESLVKEKYSLIVGVDQGINTASKLAGIQKIPYCLISYEIMFGDGIRNILKQNEIESCKNLSFAICQDPVRSYFLSIENKIPINKIFNLPVSGKYIKRHSKSDFLYKELNIPKDNKIALFAGSISKWAMIEDLVKQTDNWSKNWVLVLHDRYGIKPKFLKSLIKKRSNIYISKKSFSTPRELEKLICSADVGIGLYKSNFERAIEGKNLAFVGLSSGKLLTYLKFGVPVITNEIGQISDMIRDNECGLVVNNVSEIYPSEIEKISNCRSNCSELFKKHFDFNKKSIQLLELFSDSIENDVDIDKIKEFNRDSEFQYSQSHIGQIEYYFNLARSIKKSKYYRLGFSLLNLHLFIWNNKLIRFIRSRVRKFNLRK